MKACGELHCGNLQNARSQARRLSEAVDQWDYTMLKLVSDDARLAQQLGIAKREAYSTHLAGPEWQQQPQGQERWLLCQLEKRAC